MRTLNHWIPGVSLCVLACSTIFPARAKAAVPSVDEIVRKAEAARGPDGDVSFKVQVQDYNRNTMLRKNVYRVYSKGGKYVLVETLFPERDLGRKLLMRDGDLWLYLPSVRRPTRVSLQQRLTGQVANGDLAKTSFSEDYRAKLAGTEARNGNTYYKVMLFAKTKESTYRKIRLWVDTKTFRPWRAEFFAISGKLLKVSDYGEYRPVLGQARMTHVVIRDALQPAQQSRLKYFDYRRENLDASFFSKESLP